MTRILFAAPVLVLLAAAPARAHPPAVLDAALSEGRVTLPLAKLVEAAALPEDQSMRVVPVGSDAHTQHQVVAIRDRESPHTHDDRDLFVVMLRGHGHMRIGDEERPVGPGSVLYVPRGVVHAFRNEAEVPAVAYAVYLSGSAGEGDGVQGSGRPADPSEGGAGR